MTLPSCSLVVPEDLLAALAAEAPAGLVAQSRGPVSTPRPVENYRSRLLVERWLTDRGVEFRVKEQPDGQGRTVYVLKQCPFDSAHGDPDACIMQDPAGKLSAQCFHNSCQGRGWQHFKQAIGAPNPGHFDPPLEPRVRLCGPRVALGSLPGSEPPSAETEEGLDQSLSSEALQAAEESTERPISSRPTIQYNERQLRDVADDALAALLADQEPPVVFQRGELLTRLRLTPDSAPLLEPYRDHALRGALARAANWVELRHGKKGDFLVDSYPPVEIAKDINSLPSWPGIPVLDAMVEVPVFTPAGLVATPGYHPKGRIWYQPAPGLELPPVSEQPSSLEVIEARDWLLGELLGDFPFADEASRTHALAVLLLPFVRSLVDGPTPLHLLDAPVEGTGKTLLASVFTLVVTGRPPEAMAEGVCDEEWRKRITAALAEGPTFILLDNINHTLDSGSLAAALTTRRWKDRILGVSKTANLPNQAVWLASGNNTRLSRELIRRTIWIRLDSQREAPWERQGFRHPNLFAWVKTNRGSLVHAALTLCQAWQAAGRPAGSETLGMFESWAAVVGGILGVAGVHDLLANAREFRAEHTDQVEEWRAFTTSWWRSYGERAVGVEQLFQLVLQEQLLESELGEKNERSQRIRLGLALKKAVGRVYGECRLERAGDDHKERQLYRLRRLEPKPRVPETAPPTDCIPNLEATRDASTPEDLQEWSA